MKRKLKVTITKIRRTRMGNFYEDSEKPKEQNSKYLSDSEINEIVGDFEFDLKKNWLEKIKDEMFLENEH